MAKAKKTSNQKTFNKAAGVAAMLIGTVCVITILIALLQSPQYLKDAIGFIVVVGCVLVIAGLIVRSRNLKRK